MQKDLFEKFVRTNKSKHPIKMKQGYCMEQIRYKCVMQQHQSRRVCFLPRLASGASLNQSWTMDSKGGQTLAT
jgi:hypothetical protein